MKNIAEEKKAYRQKGKEIRASLTEEERKNKSKEIERQLYGWKPFKLAEDVCCFISFRDEVYTHYLLDMMRVMGKRVYVPIVDKEKNELILSRYHGRDELLESTFGILEPRKDYWRITDPEEIDFIILPGLLFTKDGKRLGYGGGYYDKLLSKIHEDVPRVAIAFEEQIVDDLPCDEHDKLLDAVVTDQNIYTVKEF